MTRRTTRGAVPVGMALVAALVAYTYVPWVHEWADDLGARIAPADPGVITDSLFGSVDAARTRDLLASLPVKGRAPKTGYDRSHFGPAWTDDVDVEDGHNGCSTRDDILRRDLADIVLGDDGCVVLSGTLVDAYTGKTISFERGRSTSAAVQIDHVVALMDAWQTGAQQLTPDERRDLANDPANLQAVDGPTNAGKGSGDAATWLPPNKAYRCEYVSRQVQVKSRYHLWVTQAEKDAITRVLGACRGTVPPTR